MPKCQFVNPHINMPCGKQHKLTKIIFNTPKSNEPIIKYACKADGDARFRYLSTSEDRLTKEYKQNKMKWNDYKEQIGDVRSFIGSNISNYIFTGQTFEPKFNFSTERRNYMRRQRRRKIQPFKRTL